MRPEQITKLVELEEQLVDLFTYECKPAAWRAAEKDPDRGEAYKQKKVALSTMQLIGRIQNSLRDLRASDGDTPRGKTSEREDGETDTAVTLKRVPAGLRKEAQALIKKHGKPH